MPAYRPAASALVATTLLTGGAAVADNNCPPPPITGSAGANAGTTGPSDSGGSGTVGPNAGTNANGTTDANDSNGTGLTGATGTDGANGTADSTGSAGGTADGGGVMPPPRVAGAHGRHGAPATLLIDCGDRATVQPGQYTLACADGTNYLTDLRWTHWGRNSARGTGVQHANDCTPDCAHGTFHSYSVIVTVFHRKRLAGYHGVSYFSGMRLDYGTVRPGEPTHQDYTLTP